MTAIFNRKDPIVDKHFSTSVRKVGGEVRVWGGGHQDSHVARWRVEAGSLGYPNGLLAPFSYEGIILETVFQS